MNSGLGYVVDDNQSHRGNNTANAQSRSSQTQRNLNREPNRVPTGRNVASGRSKPYRRSNNHKVSVAARRQVHPSSSQSGDASQGLLSDSSRARGNQNTITAHSQRVVAVLNRQSGQVQNTNRSQSSAAPSLL